MMATSLLRTVPTVDDWVLLPVKIMPGSRQAIRQRANWARYVRHLLFEVGHGKITNLSPEHYKIVMDQCRMRYEEYLIRSKALGRTPMPFKHIGKGYIRWWKWNQKSRYVDCDIRRNMREYEQIERVA
jgi:hypothetical protein